MVRIKALWGAFINFAVLLSFIVNLVLILVIVFLMMLIFDIKNGIAQPLISGLHSSFVGLDEARIQTNIQVKDTINVKDTIPVKLNIPLQQNTIVVLTDNVPLKVQTGFTLRDGTTLNGVVSIQLPKGLQLPVALNLGVPVDSTLPIDIKVPVNLNVPVDIPLNQTQLHGPFDRLKTLFDPFDRLMVNLPSSWKEVWPLIGCIMAGRPPDLLSNSEAISHACPAYNTTSSAPIPPSLSPTPAFGTGGALPIPSTPQVGDSGANPTARPAGTAETPPTQPAPQVTATGIQDLGILPSTK